MSVRDELTEAETERLAHLDQRAADREDPLAYRPTPYRILPYHWHCGLCEQLQDPSPSDPYCSPWCCGGRMRMIQEEQS
jgi:hypothetical protein